jgi:hypothetical protein
MSICHQHRKWWTDDGQLISMYDPLDLLLMNFFQLSSKAFK